MSRTPRPSFDIDISLCTACGGRMRIIATLTETAATRRYLESVGLRLSNSVMRVT